MQFSAEKYEKQSSYVIQSTEYNNLLHVHKVRAQSEKLLKGVNIHGLTLFIGIAHVMFPSHILPRNPHIWFILHLHVRHYLALGSIEELLSGP